MLKVLASRLQKRNDLVFHVLEGSYGGDDLLHKHGEPLVEGDGAVTVLVHLCEESISVSRSLERCRKSEPFLCDSGHVDHGGELGVGDLPVPVSVGGLETLPAEPVHLLVGLGPGVGGVLAAVHEGVLLLFVECDRKFLSLIVGVGKVEPLVEGDSSITVLVNSLELILAAASPPLEAKLLGEVVSSRDHSLELVLGDLAIKVLICRNKGPKQDVVQLDVAVIAGVLAGALHEVDKLILGSDIHL